LKKVFHRGRKGIFSFPNGGNLLFYLLQAGGVWGKKIIFFFPDFPEIHLRIVDNWRKNPSKKDR